jgi:DnaJ-class molecular chaperone
MAMQTETMIVYRGFKRETEVACDVTLLECGAGEIACIECGGDGDWTKFYPDPDMRLTTTMPCVECKDTGRTLVSV